MRHAFLIPACLAVLPLLGCATQDEAVKADMNELKHATYTMRQELDALRADVAGLKQVEPAKEEALRALRLSQAEMLEQMGALDRQIKQLQGSFEEEKHLAGRLANEQSQETLALRQRAEALEKALQAQEQKIADLSAKTIELAKPKEEPLTPEKLYDKAYAAFNDGRYAEARALFADFLKANPSHDLSGNAQFWMAETHYREKDYEAAVLAYEDVLKKYPQSRKVPAALYKQALSFLEMKDTKVAISVLKELIEKHPGSEEAKAAQARLAELQPKKK